MNLVDLPPEVIVAAARHLRAPRNYCAFGSVCKRIRYITCSLPEMQHYARALAGVPCLTCPVERIQGIIESVPTGCFAWDGALCRDIAKVARDLSDLEHELSARPFTDLEAVTIHLRRLTKCAASRGHGRIALCAARLYLRAFVCETTVWWCASDAWYSQRFDMMTMGMAAFYELDPIPYHGAAQRRCPVRVRDNTYDATKTQPLVCSPSMLDGLLRLFRLSHKSSRVALSARLPPHIEAYIISRGRVIDAAGGVNCAGTRWGSKRLPTFSDVPLMLMPPNDMTARASHWALAHPDCLRRVLLERMPSPCEMRAATYSGCPIMHPGALRTTMAVFYGDGHIIGRGQDVRGFDAHVAFVFAIARGHPDDLRALLDTALGRSVIYSYGSNVTARVHDSSMWSALFSSWFQEAHLTQGLDVDDFARSITGLWYAACELAAGGVADFAAAREDLLVDRPFAPLAEYVLMASTSFMPGNYGGPMARIMNELTHADILAQGDAMSLPRSRLLAPL